MNGLETDIDCGGGTCPACADGLKCKAKTDCNSNDCDTSVTPNVCKAAAATCTDKTLNGLETDVDCGGGTCPTCADGLKCKAKTDCKSNDCDTSVTPNVCKAAAATCTDNTMNGLETDVDCGGGTCPTCADMQKCTAATDCQSGVCDGSTAKTCTPPTCSDSVKNGDESDVDCGGPACTGAGKKCADTNGCNEDNDCTNAWCKAGACASNPTHCTNSSLDSASGETDIDCGGPCKGKCDAAMGCAKSDDCKSQICDTAATTPVCKAATCTDLVKNGDETDVDCGGATCVAASKTCINGLGCAAHTDCTNGYCNPGSGKCDTEPATCIDKVKSGDESDIDCGGSCILKCVTGLVCNGPPDCKSDKCTAGKCD